MKKKFAFVIALLLSGASLMAQKNVETVYLKNGSVIRGTIIEQVPGQSLKVQTKDGNIFVYQMDEVERIAKEAQQTTSGSSGLSGHGHRGLDYSFEGGVGLGRGGSATGMGGIEVGKRFSQNFYWGIGVGVMGGNSASAQIPVTTTFKALFPVTASGIAPNIALRTGFLANTAGSKTYGSGRYAQTVKAKHGWEMSLMPGIQIPLGQKVDFNLNMGYLCNVIFGGGAAHSFAMNAGFGFHKPYERKEKQPKVKVPVPTRNKGMQYSIEGAAGFGGSKVIHTGPALVLSYKMNPNLSVGLGYRMGFFAVSRDLDYSDNRTKDTEDGYDGLASSLFLRGQYRLNDKKFSPFASVDIGVRAYSLDVNTFTYKDYTFDDDPEPRSSGFLFTPAIGASLRTTNNSYLEFKIGYNCTSGLKEVEGVNKNQKSNTLTLKKAGFGDFFFSIGYTHTLKWGSGAK